jgi:hypothetical protein
MAILGMIPPRTAPRPLYRPNAVSFRTMSRPVVTKPRGFAWHVVSQVNLLIERRILTPGAFARLDSCIRTLTVSSGWHTSASIMPAPPPAARESALHTGSQRKVLYLLSLQLARPASCRRFPARSSPT